MMCGWKSLSRLAAGGRWMRVMWVRANEFGASLECFATSGWQDSVREAQTSGLSNEEHTPENIIDHRHPQRVEVPS